MTLNELKEYLKPLIHFGTMELKISDNDGHDRKIEVFERDEYIYERDGDTIHGGDLTRPFALIVGKDGKIGFIEHPYHAFTSANKDDVVYLIGLIGETVLFE
jgi:hypothetical protein